MIFTRDYEDIRKELMQKAIKDNMPITSRDIALRMGVRSEPAVPITVVSPFQWISSSEIYQRITRAMEWLYDADIAHKTGKEPLMSMNQYIHHKNKFEYPATNSTTINADSATMGISTSNLTISTDCESIVGVDSSSVASSTGYSFTIHNPSITQDIIDDLTKPSADSHLTIEFGDLNDVVNKKLFSTKNFNLPIRPLRYFQPGNGRLTVEWTDHTKTVVTPSDPEHADIFSGICIAYTKKMFGSTTAIIKAIEQAKWTTDAPKRLRKMKQDIDKSKKHLDRELAKKAHERMVQNCIEAIKVEQEAQKRIAEEKEASNNA